MSTQTHYHVAYGLAGYGPDDIGGQLETLSDALECARDELATDVDSAHEAILSHIESQEWEQACEAFTAMEALEILRMNLDPKRRSAPMYVNDPAAYAALQETQLDLFPVDVGTSSRLYVWECDADCEIDDE